MPSRSHTARDDHRTWELADERARPEVSVELLAAREAVAAAGMTAREWRIVGLHADRVELYRSVASHRRQRAHGPAAAAARPAQTSRRASSARRVKTSPLAAPVEVVQLAIRNGVIVAIIGATRHHLAPHVEDLDAHDPDRHAITNLCQLVLADGR